MLFLEHIKKAPKRGEVLGYPELIRNAFPGDLLVVLNMCRLALKETSCSPNERSLFLLALLAILPKFSRAQATGGWLKWVENAEESDSIVPSLSNQIDLMIEDIKASSLPARKVWYSGKADARSIPVRSNTYTALITSPPYPNRHDYTRVFGVELMFEFLDWYQTRELRYQSIESHPEARPRRIELKGYKRPELLVHTLAEVEKVSGDVRIGPMLDGYFKDIYLCLQESRRVCKAGAKMAFVLGNTQYFGVSIPVDEITGWLGLQLGLACKEISVARFRGNSAQQMDKHGRRPSRESIVVFERD